MNWLDALHETLDEMRGREFAWGTIDCCQFTARYVARRTGTNWADEYRYTNEAEANDMLEAAGGIDRIVTAALGAPCADAEPGDVVLCRLGECYPLGVFNGAFVWSVVEGHGLARLAPTSIALRWRV